MYYNTGNCHNKEMEDLTNLNRIDDDWKMVKTTAALIKLYDGGNCAQETLEQSLSLQEHFGSVPLVFVDLTFS